MSSDKETEIANLEEEISEQQKRITEAIQNAEKPEPSDPRINTYICDKCGGSTHTVDVAEGTTTMVLPCMKAVESRIVTAGGDKATKCDGQMMSSFYTTRGVPLSEIDYEWRFATLPEYREYKQRHLALADHVASGGLVLHKRTNAQAPVFTHGGFFVRPDGSRLDDNEAAALQSGLQVLKETLILERKKAKRKEHQKREAKAKAKAKRRRKGKR